MKRMILVCVVVLCGGSCFGDVLYVGDGQAYATIQSAIDDCNEGDVVVVEPNTYNEDVTFNGTNIVVTSVDPNDPEVTIIQGTGTGPVVTFSGTEDSNCVVDGFTITGGHTSGNGSGIYGGGTRATIRNCVVRDNESGYPGGSIYACHGAISRCTIAGNTASERIAGLNNCDGTIDEKGTLHGNLYCFL